TGGRTFQWQTPFGVTQNTAGLLDFVVNPPLAKLTAINPTFGLRPSNPTVTLTGSGFVAGATTVSAGDLSVSNVQVQSPTSLTAVFAIPAGAAIGSRNVTVTTTTTSNAVSFAVPGAPTFASILPVSAYRGESVVVTLTGTNF